VSSPNFLCSHFPHNHNNSTAEYLTNIRNESPYISYDRQWLWPWYVFKWLGVVPFIRPDLCGAHSAVTSLEHVSPDWMPGFDD